MAKIKTTVEGIAQILGHTQPNEKGEMVVVTPGIAPEGIEARAIKLRNSLQLITTWAELDELPDYSIVLGEIMEYHGIHYLVKERGSWPKDYVSELGYDPCWYTFSTFDSQIEICDDFTPELPVLLLFEGSPDLDDEDLD